MDFSIFNLSSKKDACYYIGLIKNIVDEFQELDNKYQTLAIILAEYDQFKDGAVSNTIKQFLSTEGPIICSTDRISSSGSIGNKGYISIILDQIRSLPLWHQKLAIRHECGHLLLHSSIAARATEGLLKKGYPIGFLSKMRAGFNDYQVHILMLNKYPNDWLKTPVRITEKAGSPRKWYRHRKKRLGLTQTLLDAIWNSFNLLRLIYLYKYIVDNVTDTDTFQKDLQRYKRYLKSFWNCVKKDSKGNLPSPMDWICIDHLKDEETFFQRVSYLLDLCFGKPRFEKVHNNKSPVSTVGSIQSIRSGSIQFSSVAIGGPDAWRSESMKKIQDAPKSDVKTIIRFDLPFSLLRLPDGSYEMSEEAHTYRILIRRIRRDDEVSQKLTGWIPHGDIDIIGDRFGRFSYSRIEIQIPYKIDEDMWDYVCPNCRTYVSQGTTSCSVCSSKFLSQNSRVPPRKKAKIKAIEIMNKFIDRYRFLIKDYFVEHIRYNDVVTYEIEYIAKDGTKAHWLEAFSLSADSTVKTGVLTTKPDELRSFRKILSRPDRGMALRDYLLASAENRVSTEEYHLAVLESVFALEITLSRHIREGTKRLGIPKKKVRNLIGLGLSSKFEAVWEILSSDRDKPPDSIYWGCKRAIRKRNRIVHEAETATYNEAREAVWNIKRMIENIVNSSRSE